MWNFSNFWNSYLAITTVFVLGDFGLPWYNCHVDENDATIHFNDTIDSMISYKKWFFGHWHSDLGFDNYANSKFVPLYHKGIVL